MKLLSRQEINQQKSLERKLEIDEGVKLAKKIDTLRQTAAQEEANLAKFRTETLKIIRDEIDKLLADKVILLQEIEDLKRQKELLDKQ